MMPQELSLYALLRWDLLRQRELLGNVDVNSGFKLWLGLFYPRFIPVLLCRLAYELQRKKLGIIAKLFSMLNVFVFGIEIATQCKIGPGLFFPHTHGTVIGAIAIGNNATIYQGVTIGAKDLDFSYDLSRRPVIGNNVLIGSGAKILGGFSIGDNVTIGANAVLLQAVPDNQVVGGIPAQTIGIRNN